MIARRSENELKQESFANIEIENAVLGSLIAGGRRLIDKLGVEAIDLNLFFYSQSHKILAGIAELYDEGAPYDLQVVTERLRQQGALEGVGGAAAITVLGIDGNSDPDIVRYNLGLLRNLEVKRRTARVAERMQRGDVDLEEARKILDEITRYSHDPARPLIEVRSRCRPLRIDEPETQLDFKDWQTVISVNFPVYARPAEICASVIVQLLLNDVSNPFALALVDVPSSGKTITLNFFDVPHLAYTTDNSRQQVSSAMPVT